MKISTIEYLYGCPYISRANLCEQMNMSKNAVDVRIREIKEQIKLGRYGEFAYIKDGGFVLLSYLAWIDYMKYRDRLKDRNLKKGVPAFEPKKVAEAIGWYGTCA